MDNFRGALLACAFLASISCAVSAQEAVQPTAPSSSSGALSTELPAVCTADKGPAAMMSMNMPHGMDEAHADMMEHMHLSNEHMMQGMMAADIDIAFVCGMIPHHQGAIEMAKAELEHGDDPWAQALARKVIDAQEKEIAEMVEWLQDADDSD